MQREQRHPAERPLSRSSDLRGKHRECQEELLRQSAAMGLELPSRDRTAFRLTKAGIAAQSGTVRRLLTLALTLACGCAGRQHTEERETSEAPQCEVHTRKVSAPGPYAVVYQVEDENDKMAVYLATVKCPEPHSDAPPDGGTAAVAR